MQSVVINGTQYPFRCSFRALAKFQTQTGKKLEDMSDMSLNDLAVITTCSINAAYRLTNEDKVVELDDIIDGIDEDMGSMSSITEALGNDMNQISGESVGK